MDLSLDSKELLETLSQGSQSGRSQSTRSPLPPASSHAATTSTTNNNNKRSALVGMMSSNTSVASSHVDEAFRRLGQKLSLQAHGDDASSMQSARIRRTLKPSARTAFEAYSTTSSSASASPTTSMTDNTHGPQRTNKVAKTNYADHGAHCPTPKRHLLRRLTYDAENLYRTWQSAQSSLQQQQQQQDTAATESNDTVSMMQQHQHQSQQSALFIDSGGQLQYQASPSNYQTTSRRHHHHQQLYGSSSISHKAGLLSSVMEGQNESTPSIRLGAPDRSPSCSISTKESVFSLSSHQFASGLAATDHHHHLQQQQQEESAPDMPRGACLTLPSEGVANDGLDNSEGNLIVFENDVLSVPRPSLHTLDELNPNHEGAPFGKQPQDQQSIAEFRIQSCLGQGTFAQVFQCLYVPTGEIVALKIIKNKPAYTRQATVEIDVFRSLKQSAGSGDYMVSLEYFFMYKNHLCLVFEKLGFNLYEVLKKRQFRGLPLSVVRSLVRQVIVGIKDLTQNHVVHCDLKPENILLVSEAISHAVVNAGESLAGSAATKNLRDDVSASLSSNGGSSTSGSAESREAEQPASSSQPYKTKIIDFGSACFEGHTAHTYIQSRFYRCPEVLIGLPYDSGIDMWSLGCVAAELFLGLPILPGCHEHDQLGRIQEMIADIPDWMLAQGAKSTKYYVKYRPNVTPNSEQSSPMQMNSGGANRTPSPWTSAASASPSAPSLPQWRLKTQQEYISSLSQSEISKKGGLAKLEKQPGHRYFKSKKLVDIIAMHAQQKSDENKEQLMAFIHLLYGILEPDPWKRFTALQVAQHPFLTGNVSELKSMSEASIDTKEENQANLLLGMYWQVPFDPAILRRKLLNVQRQREKQQQQQQSSRRHASGRSSAQSGMMSDLSLQSASKGRARMDLFTGKNLSGASMQLRRDPGDGRFSPPDQLSTGGGTSQRLRVAEAEGRVGLVSASLSNLVGAQGASSTFGTAHLAVRTTPSNQQPFIMTGPQSFGIHDDLRRVPQTAGDFAFVLNRPGIVPGAGSASGFESGTPVGSYPYGARGPPSSLDYDSYPSTPSFPAQHQPMSSSSVRSMASTSMQSVDRTGGMQTRDPLYADAGGQLRAHALQQQHQQQQHAASLQLQQQQQRQLFPEQRQQQHPMQQQQQQQQQHHHQQQQQQQPMQQQLMPQQFQQSYGIAPQASQQPAIYAMNDPSGRVYYVTTSITGQPVILQPVAPGNFASPQWQGNAQPQNGFVNDQAQLVYQESSLSNPAMQLQTNGMGYGGVMPGNGTVQGSGMTMDGQMHIQHNVGYAALPTASMQQQQQQQFVYQQQQQPQASQYLPMQYSQQAPQQQQQPGIQYAQQTLQLQPPPSGSYNRHDPYRTNNRNGM